MSPEAAEGAFILLAEDEPLASMALRAQVEALGYSVAGVARDGAEALAMGQCLPIDLAVFDMKMPGRSGLDAAVELFDHAPVPVVLLTGFGAADLPSPVPAPPIFSILTKPVGLADLREGLEQARSAFDAWVDEDPGRADRVREARERRTVIARALSEQGDDAPASERATTLLDRARAEDASPLEIARRILDGG